MKIEVHLSQFKKMIGLAERVAQKNPTLPVLSCLLFEVSKNSLKIKSTNLDIGLEVNISAKSDITTTIAVPAKTVYSFISQLNDMDEIVKLELVSNNLNISSKKSNVTIKTIPPDDFPSIPKIIDGTEIEISSEVFVKGLKSVWYSASISSVKPELSSVYIYKNNEYLVFAATDSFRLAEKKIKTNIPDDFQDILIPFKNVSEIIRVLEDVGGNVVMKTNKNLVSFENNEVYITSRIIDGTFPDYKQIIPKSFSTEIITLKQDIINALKVSNVFADKFNQIRFTIDPKGKGFEIQTKNTDIGENITKVDASINGEKVEINFNGKYVTDCFQSIDSDSVSFELGGLNRPMVIKPVAGDGSFIYLVMPMNR